ncbi:MAG: type II secretion system F family protein [Hyphomicrobiales bacterium]|nr:type II secretion system F family protein [Hyphomicrobiales bacterium]
MDMIREIILELKPDGMMPFAVILGVFGFGLIGYVLFGQSRMREATRNRLSLKNSPVLGLSQNTGDLDDEQVGPSAAAKAKALVPKKVLKKASDFYASSDPDNIIRIRQKLIRAGFLEPGAVGIYFVLRVVSAILLFAVVFSTAVIVYADMPFSNQLAIGGAGGLIGYFMPNLVLNHIITKRILEYRAGFPDFMDLMIVCADAGMSMEAAIERVSREITLQYPALSQNLAIITIELRAGRQLADALRSLSDRLGLDEVRSFATLLQQSKELGTSLSDTLRVFSDEMRHKRMSLAEEKAHALPAKMTIPVTVFILPVIMLIATIPVIVRLSE